MSDKIYGKCTRCGGNLTISHICAGSKNHAEFNKSLNLANELLNLEQKNEALLAQVEELRKFKDHEIGQFVNDVTAIAVKYAGCQSMRGALSAYIAPKLQAISQQSLDSLKARIEEETIDRCSKAVETLLRPIDSSAALPDHSGMLENLMANTAIDVLADMPRKYQPSSDTKEK